MSNETLQTEARLGRALVALQEWQGDSGARGRLSTSEWAAAAGVPPSEAWKLAQELRALGADVEGSPAQGWSLGSEADLALPEVLNPKIAGTIFAGGVHHFARIGSTNAAAMRAGAAAVAHEANANRSAVWLAEEQTAGKGRAGHTWKSNPGDGIYCSALMRPRVSPADAVILSLAAGLAVVEAVHEVTGRWGDLRWPNDVLMGGRKFCGILTELNAEFSTVRYVVVGMGLNVNNLGFPPELEAIATSLYIEAGQRFSRVTLVAALLRALDREQAALQNGVGAARESILRRFEKYSSYCCGCAVMVEEDGGYEGVTRGLDDRGFLRVETSQGMRTVLSGGVRKR
jgi:BirA family transcriptional regulator, biotin operon repressor / biotin---[acetyl-CoA-carboxylase] ligase